MKYDLLTDIFVQITQGELDCINKLPSIETRKNDVCLIGSLERQRKSEEIQDKQY